MTMNAPAYGLVMMALLMASASGQTFTEGEATCVGCFRSANDCDWSATAINIASPTRTPRGDEGCAALCMVNTACTHYTFIVLFPGDDYCIQKSATASATLTIPTFGPPGIGSSCGWMFGRSPQIDPSPPTPTPRPPVALAYSWAPNCDYRPPLMFGGSTAVAGTINPSSSLDH